MAKPDLRDARTKRRILYSDRATDEERNACADEFLAQERFGEALEFLDITKDPSRLSRVEEAALERGDTFLLLRIARIRGRPLPPETWRRAGETALRLGKHLDAFRAFEEAGDEERAEAIRTEHLPGFRRFEPEGE